MIKKEKDEKRMCAFYDDLKRNAKKALANVQDDDEMSRPW